MQYILTEEEMNVFRDLQKRRMEFDPVLLKQLRKKIMREANFTCYKDLTDEEKKTIYVGEGYCGDCPLGAFTGINTEFTAAHRFCPGGATYSK